MVVTKCEVVVALEGNSLGTYSVCYFTLAFKILCSISLFLMSFTYFQQKNHVCVENKEYAGSTGFVVELARVFSRCI